MHWDYSKVKIKKKRMITLLGRLLLKPLLLNRLPTPFMKKYIDLYVNQKSRNWKMWLKLSKYIFYSKYASSLVKVPYLVEIVLFKMDLECEILIFGARVGVGKFQDL